MKKSILVLILSLGLVAIGATNIISLSQDNVSVTRSQQEEATVQTGILTEKQRHHSKLYKKYRRDKKIPDLAREYSIDFGITIGAPTPGGLPGEPTYSEKITALACDADTVVVGVVKNKTSLLTEDEDFIFTDYELIVEEVIKNNASDPIKPNAEITVSNPGGKIQLNNRIIEARDLSFPPLVIGEQYLLLLKSTSIHGGYKAV